MRSSTFVLAACAALAFAAGCSKSGNGSSSSGSSGSGGTSSSSGSGSTSGSSGSSGDAGPTPCTTDTQCTAPQICQTDPGASGFCGAPCQYDDQCASGHRCDEQSGHCIQAKACDDSTIASPVDACADSVSDGGYCPDQGNHCRCTTSDGGRGAGVCRRVRPDCAPCTDASECNPCPEGDLNCDPSKYVFPALCAPVGSNGTYCLRKSTVAGCPFGYVPDQATGACQPNTGTCTNFAPCGTDQDCVLSVGPGHYCDASQGICKEFCQFDPVQGASVNCPPGQVCNVNPQYVLPDAGLARYGVGTCGAPCDATPGTDCNAVAGSSGLDFACVQEKSGEHRCRPVSSPDGGGCMYDSECPPWADGGVYYGYCGIYEFSCRYDCRVGIDPLNGSAYSAHDCQPPSGSTTSYKCVESGDAGICVEKNCVERGGAAHGAAKQFCCGEDRDHTGYLDGGFADLSHPANACIAGVDAGEYYTAPAPPWCQSSCEPSGQPYPDGGYPLFATCDPSLGFPNFDPLGSPNLCYTYAQDQAGNPIANCAIAAQYTSECPRGWQFGSVPTSCNADPDCQEQYPDAGASTQGHCTVYPDGGGHFCACSQPELVDGGGYVWGGQCPNQTRCIAQKCALTRACLPTLTVCPP